VAANKLSSALKRLIADRAGSDDLILLQQAFAKGQIAFATGKSSVAIGGNASHNIIITSDKLTFELTDEALQRLIPPLTPHQAPALPQYYIPRPEYRDPLLNLLLAPASSQPGMLVVSAVQGLGGIGKTTLVADLAHDPRLQARFPDGILWVTLGQQPDLLSLLHDWIRTLGEYKYSPLTVDSASRQLCTLLDEKACLLVIDDAWQADHARPFLVGGAGCQVLITTRDTTLAQKLHARLFDLDVMTEAQSLALFDARLGMLGDQRLVAAALARELGYLPLALELVAAQIEGGQSWPKLLAAFRKGLADLDALSLDEATQRNESLRLSFRLSLEQLPQAEQDSFDWLGVLPEDAQLNPQMAATLWELTSEEASRRLQRFRSKALLKTLGDERFTVHDLLHDEAKLRLAQRIPIPEAQALLLDRYRLLCRPVLSPADHAVSTPIPNSWHTLPDDDYIHAHLTWHMQQAQQPEAIYALLQEETENGKNGWYGACFQVGQLAIFSNDLNNAWSFVNKYALDHPELGRYLAFEIQLALCHASIRSQSSNYPPELLGIAVREEIILPAQALTLAKYMLDENKQASALCCLAPYLPSNMIHQALAIAQNIKEKKAHAAALTGLIPYLPPERRSMVSLQILSIIQSSSKRNSFTKASLLKELVPHLTPELFPQALIITQNIDDTQARISTLAYFAPHLSFEQLSQTMFDALSLEHESVQKSTLVALAPYLSPDQFSQALVAAQSLEDEKVQASALTSLAPYLTHDLLSQAITKIDSITDELIRADALTKLISYLPSEQRSTVLAQILATIRSTSKNFTKVALFKGLAPHLSPELFPTAIEIAQGINDIRAQTLALAGVASQLPIKLLSHTLFMALSFQDEVGQTAMLVDLAPHLPPELYSKALLAVQSLENESIRASMLACLVPYLTPDLLSQAIAIILSITDVLIRADSLTKLIPYLPFEQRARVMAIALETAQIIGDGRWQVNALCHLALFYPTSNSRKIIISRALVSTKAISREYDQVVSLSELVVCQT